MRWSIGELIGAGWFGLWSVIFTVPAVTGWRRSRRLEAEHYDIVKRDAALDALGRLDHE